MTDGLHQITPPSAVVLNERRYPVIYEAPTWSQIWGNLRSEDVSLMGTAAVVGAPWGYFLGYKYNVQKQSARLGVVLFATAALAHVTMKSAARLMGVAPNDAEVRDILEKPGK